eukprot:CAMPEP_0116895594 /NCGR_PEP_ID=MMETSP0467-20121206/5079_1 /TAXON_ID=283647 /ORGANISM="Mesodinium pulex, Strain SPMC105" /LENGTH=98 /DNA_ID=CAMNT_0004566403 /DNA_START=717 /DNA_END=1013 /DNA_ORIENTATION=+
MQDHVLRSDTLGEMPYTQQPSSMNLSSASLNKKTNVYLDDNIHLELKNKKFKFKNNLSASESNKTPTAVSISGLSGLRETRRTTKVEKDIIGSFIRKD